MVLFALAVLALSSCADPNRAARLTILSVAGLQKAAAESLKQYDKAYQMGVVKAAKTEAEGAAALAEYRAKRNKAVQSFEGLYIATVAAEKALALAELGQEKKANLQTVVMQLLDAFGKLRHVLTDLGVPLGGVQWSF